MDIMLKNILDLIDANYQKDEDFEKEFGIAKSTVSAWRRGKLMSYQKNATKIAAFFKVSSDWISGNGQKNKLTANGEPVSDSAVELSKKLDQISDKGLEDIARYIDLILEHEKSDKK